MRVISKRYKKKKKKKEIIIITKKFWENLKVQIFFRKSVFQKNGIMNMHYRNLELKFGRKLYRLPISNRILQLCPLGETRLYRNVCMKKMDSC